MTGRRGRENVLKPIINRYFILVQNEPKHGWKEGEGADMNEKAEVLPRNPTSPDISSSGKCMLAAGSARTPLGEFKRSPYLIFRTQMHRNGWWPGSARTRWGAEALPQTNCLVGVLGRAHSLVAVRALCVDEGIKMHVWHLSSTRTKLRELKRSKCFIFGPQMHQNIWRPDSARTRWWGLNAPWSSPYLIFRPHMYQKRVAVGLRQNPLGELPRLASCSKCGRQAVKPDQVTSLHWIQSQIAPWRWRACIGRKNS